FGCSTTTWLAFGVERSRLAWALAPPAVPRRIARARQSPTAPRHPTRPAITSGPGGRPPQQGGQPDQHADDPEPGPDVAEGRRLRPPRLGGLDLGDQVARVRHDGRELHVRGGLDVVEAPRPRLERLVDRLVADRAREREDVGAGPGRDDVGRVGALHPEARLEREL